MSNLAVHWIPVHDYPGDLELIASHSRKLVKVVYNGDPDNNHARTVLESIDGDGVFIIRNWALSEQKDDVVRDPEATGRRHAQNWKAWVDQSGLDRHRFRFEGINEFPMWVHGNDVYNRYNVAYMDEADRLDINVMVGEINVGWPANSGGDTPSNWMPYLETLRRLSWPGHWVGLHEYFGLGGPNDESTGMVGWWAYRYRHLIDFCKQQGLGFPPIVITELGICKDYKDDEGNILLDPQSGWMGHIEPGTAFEHLSTYARVSAADGIIAGTIFTTDGGHPWIESMATQGFHDQWRAYDVQSIDLSGTTKEVHERKPAAHVPVITSVNAPRPDDPIYSHSFMFPVVPGPITQHFGQNEVDYSQLAVPGHTGLDIGCPEGTPVSAFTDGLVAWVGVDDDYGNYVRIHHPLLNFDTFYAHLSEISVQQGQSVAMGDHIAKSGNTGYTTGPHLHFEVRMTDAQGNYLDSAYGRGRCDPETVVATLARTWGQYGA
jgi:murein DD-endopeptidase MepM/ murein hydrolase activator NlpD